MTLAILVFFVNILISLRNGKKSGPNPWGARTLEWQIPSPPHYYNFKHIPTVYGLPYDFAQPLAVSRTWKKNSPIRPSPWELTRMAVASIPHGGHIDAHGDSRSALHRNAGPAASGLPALPDHRLRPVLVVHLRVSLHAQRAARAGRRRASIVSTSHLPRSTP